MLGFWVVPDWRCEAGALVPDGWLVLETMELKVGWRAGLCHAVGVGLDDTVHEYGFGAGAVLLGSIFPFVLSDSALSSSSQSGRFPRTNLGPLLTIEAVPERGSTATVGTGNSKKGTWAGSTFS